MKNLTDSHAKGHTETVSMLDQEANNALAEALNYSLEVKNNWNTVFFYPTIR